MINFIKKVTGSLAIVIKSRLREDAITDLIRERFLIYMVFLNMRVESEQNKISLPFSNSSFTIAAFISVASPSLVHAGEGDIRNFHWFCFYVSFVFK